MKVRFTRSAEQSLGAIGDFIAADNPDRAITLLDELRAVALSLTEFPQALPIVPQFVHAGVRRRLHGDYLVLYRIEADAIFILNIVHGARDIDNLLQAAPRSKPPRPRRFQKCGYCARSGQARHVPRPMSPCAAP